MLDTAIEGLKECQEFADKLKRRIAEHHASELLAPEHLKPNRTQ
jgi:hypothetical protein